MFGVFIICFIIAIMMIVGIFIFSGIYIIIDKLSDCIVNFCSKKEE